MLTMRSLETRVRLNNDTEMPIFGLGTWKMSPGQETEKAVLEALRIGYRLIDTAALYGNETSVGKAVRESGIPRKEIFVTTKLWAIDFLNPIGAFEKSMKRLGLEYVDLYLVHWPIPLMPKSIWRAMEKTYEEKRARAIGISNYGIGDIEKLLKYARILPAVNQIQFSLFDFAEEILAYCRENGIAVEAYSPLTRGSHLQDPTIQKVARKYGKTPAQIMIRWCLEHGAIPIPKSIRSEHIRENANVFDFTLSKADMELLDQLG